MKDAGDGRGAMRESTGNGAGAVSASNADRSSPSHSEEAAPACSVRLRRRAAQAIVVLAILAVAGAWLAASTPSWWRPPPLDSAVADDHARALEQGLAAEFTRIRPDSEPWAIRIRTEDANAWLAIRLAQWLEHERELPWPEGVELVQVSFASPDRVTLGVRRGGWIWSITLRAALENGHLSLTPTSGGVGRLWIPWSVASGVDGAPRVTDFVPELSRSGHATLTLPDGRSVKLLDLECDADGLRMRLETLPRAVSSS